MTDDREQGIDVTGTGSMHPKDLEQIGTVMVMTPPGAGGVLDINTPSGLRRFVLIALHPSDDRPAKEIMEHYKISTEGIAWVVDPPSTSGEVVPFPLEEMT